ncbi:hypothetical protein L3Q82_004850 [Scortum barcoo]|uniref:Uncharacterized protein n=1 Tax=Scortum barcoo TaxID=214431 RepID=A0ACB8VDY8_9TELE|nr:hypothetical protein L3Q82_004850 [Scortum barcoo]
MWRSVLPLLLCLSPAGLFLLQLPGCTATRWEDYKYGRQGSELRDKKDFCTWKCLIFTLQWPGGFCQSLNKETLCKIPESINNWTIHGLWLLEDASITPSCERPYKIAEVRQVLTPHLGEKYEIQCVRDDKDREVWFQVKVLLSRNLTVGCDHHGNTEGEPGRSPSPGHPCPPEVPFYYFPIDHQQPEKPCG